MHVLLFNSLAYTLIASACIRAGRKNRNARCLKLPLSCPTCHEKRASDICEEAMIHHTIIDTGGIGFFFGDLSAQPIYTQGGQDRSTCVLPK